MMPGGYTLSVKGHACIVSFDEAAEVDINNTTNELTHSLTQSLSELTHELTN